MTPPNPVRGLDSLIHRAHRRTVTQSGIEVLLTGAAAALAVFILVLIAGTGLLHWGWAVASAVVGAAWAWFRKRRRMPDSYRTAQQIDHALESKDLLSTAWHFGHSSRQSEFVDTVLRQADGAVSGADVEVLIPWRMPRSGYVAVGLAAVCVLLLGVRLGVLKTLDLRAGLAEVRFDTVTGAAVAPDKKMTANRQQRPFEGIGVDIPGYEQASLRGVEKQEQFQQLEVESNEPGAQGAKGQRPQSGDQGESGEGGEKAGDEASGEEAPTGSQDPSRAPGDRGQAKPEKPNSLLDKMRDAMANLMEKLKMQPEGGEGKQSASNKSAQQGQGQKKGDKGQKGSQQNAQADADGQKSEGEGEGAQSEQAKARTDQPPEPPSGEPKSGAGSQDGSKETEMAQDAEAMGKLSELFGRRSQNVKGEVMMEVTRSRNQALRTPLVERSATHTEAGGEVSRDEVPLHLQEYVQRYYEKVRKPATAGEGKQ